MKRCLLAAVLLIAACTSGSDGLDRALFDVAGDNDMASPIESRAPVPQGAQAVFTVRSYADPAAFDELLAQAESVAELDQVVITADLSGCILLTLWARPEPDTVRIGYEFDPNTDCAEAIEYRALFIIDEVGTNAGGSWDYTAGVPDVDFAPQPPS